MKEKVADILWRHLKYDFHRHSYSFVDDHIWCVAFDGTGLVNLHVIQDHIRDIVTEQIYQGLSAQK